MAQPNITRVEYFIDTDPGMGLATATPITPGNNLANQTISFDPTALTPGVHFFGIRSRNANGAWSHTNYLAFAKAFPTLPAEAATTNITRVEYFIDTDPGIGLATVKPITPGNNLANQTISFDPTALTPGVHFLGIRSRNANGAWSHTNYLAFAKAFPDLPAEPAQPDINKIEYFIDSDPGMGNGIPVAFASGKNTPDAIANINVTELVSGEHTLGWRSRQANGAWSHTVLLEFNVPSVLAAPAINVNSASKTTLCAGDSLYVGYHATGTFNAGNTFKLFLSDGTGSFASETEIGSISSSAKGGIFAIKLPTHMADGTGYKLRIKASNTALTGMASTATLTIRDRPYAKTVAGRTQANGTFGYPYTVPATASSTFNWLITNGTQTNGTNTNAVTASWLQPLENTAEGLIRVIETNQYGCIGDTSLLSPITVYKLDIGDTVAASVCKGNMLEVKIGATGSFDAGNTFTAQLSNASGNFNSPTASASIPLSGDGVNQLATIILPIPTNLPNGNGYRVRVRSSNPNFIGDTTGNIAIQKPNIGIDITGAYCQGLGYNLTQHYTNNAITYTYFTNAFAPVVKPDSVQAGIYQVIGKNSFGCPDTARVTITENPKPNIGADTTLFHVCVGEKSNLNPLYTTTGLTAVWNTGTPASVSPGLYQLIVTNSFGCKDTAIAHVVLPTAIWTGAVSTNWHTAGNWSSGKVPDAATHVIILGVTPNVCIISQENAFASSVQLKNGATLQQTNGRQLLIDGKCAVLPTP
jgi:hypothetical protein